MPTFLGQVGKNLAAETTQAIARDMRMRTLNPQEIFNGLDPTAKLVYGLGSAADMVNKGYSGEAAKGDYLKTLAQGLNIASGNTMKPYEAELQSAFQLGTIDPKLREAIVANQRGVGIKDLPSQQKTYVKQEKGADGELYNVTYQQDTNYVPTTTPLRKIDQGGVSASGFGTEEITSPANVIKMEKITDYAGERKAGRMDPGGYNVDADIKMEQAIKEQGALNDVYNGTTLFGNDPEVGKITKDLANLDALYKDTLSSIKLDDSGNVINGNDVSIQQAIKAHYEQRRQLEDQRDALIKSKLDQKGIKYTPITASNRSVGASEVSYIVPAGTDKESMFKVLKGYGTMEKKASFLATGVGFDKNGAPVAMVKMNDRAGQPMWVTLGEVVDNAPAIKKYADATGKIAFTTKPVVALDGKMNFKAEDGSKISIGDALLMNNKIMADNTEGRVMVKTDVDQKVKDYMSNGLTQDQANAQAIEDLYNDKTIPYGKEFVKALEDGIEDIDSYDKNKKALVKEAKKNQEAYYKKVSETAEPITKVDGVGITNEILIPLTEVGGKIVRYDGKMKILKDNKVYSVDDMDGDPANLTKQEFDKAIGKMGLISNKTTMGVAK